MMRKKLNAKVDSSLLYEMAKGQVPLQSIVTEAKRDELMFHQGHDYERRAYEHLLSRLESLEARIRALEQS